MRIMLAGDCHGDIVHMRYLMDRARESSCSRIFVLGDFGYYEHMKDGVKFLDSLNTLANLRNIPVYFLDGNHDKTSLIISRYDNEEHTDPEGFLKVRPYVLYSRRGHRFTWDATTFITLGGAYSVDKEERLKWEKAGSGKAERHWFPEEEMTDQEMAQILENTDPVDVILAHDKPRASNPRWNRKSWEECLPNQDRLQSACATLGPRYFFHGHLHYDYVDDITYGHLGEMHVTRVMGLLCNKNDFPFGGWAGDRSYLIFDTEVTDAPGEFRYDLEAKTW